MSGAGGTGPWGWGLRSWSAGPLGSWISHLWPVGLSTLHFPPLSCARRVLMTEDLCVMLAQ